MKTSLFSLLALFEAICVSASPRHVIRRDVARSKLICGKAGYDAGTESFWGSTDGPYSACSSACAQQQCRSFAYGAGECQLYDVSVQSNFVGVGDSPYLFYDSSCMTSTTSTTTTTTTTSRSSGKTSSSTKMTTTTSSKPASTTTIAKMTSSSTSTKAVTTTTSTKTATPPSSTTTTTKSTPVTSSSTTRTATQTTPQVASTTIATTTTKKLTTSSTSTSPSSTTTGSNNLVCGQEGYFSGSSGFHGYQTDYDSPTQEALSQCYQYCVNSDEGYCAGWYWSQNTCVLFLYPPEGYHFQASPGNGMYVWDRNCGAPVAK